MEGITIINREGNREPFDPEKIRIRITALYQKHAHRFTPGSVDPEVISDRTIRNVGNNMKTSAIDEMTAQICVEMSHPEYEKFAVIILLDNLYKATPKTFANVIKTLHKNGQIEDDFARFVEDNASDIEKHIDYERDYLFTYMGLETMKSMYLMRDSRTDQIAELPQHAWMRVALFLWYGRVTKTRFHEEINDLADVVSRGGPNAVNAALQLIEKCRSTSRAVRFDKENTRIPKASRAPTNMQRGFELYDAMSLHKCTLATPFLFGAGAKEAPLNSCYLVDMRDKDSIEGIFDTFSDISRLMKMAGGVGVGGISDIRSLGSLIHSTGKKAKGLVPVIEILEKESEYVDQGGRRPGRAAVYYEPWYADIFQLLDLRKKHNKVKLENVFNAVFCTNYFFEQVEKDGDWYLMSPDTAPGLTNSYGDDFVAQYKRYISEGRYTRCIKARELMMAIITSQIECGTPYILNKDACNQFSMQKSAGVLTCSNLCAEITIYSDKYETGVCNLASVCIPKFLKGEIPEDIDPDQVTVEYIESLIDMDELRRVVELLTDSCNNAIDATDYPDDKTMRSNRRWRPIGIGQQGLATAMINAWCPYDSKAGRLVNRIIQESISFFSLNRSCELASIYGPFPMWERTEYKMGKLPWQLWQEYFEKKGEHDLARACIPIAKCHDWDGLSSRVATNGMRNVFCTANMPTASSSSTFGNSEGFEPIPGCSFIKKAQTGNFAITNKKLVEYMTRNQMWKGQKNSKVYDSFLAAGCASIQHITEIPENVRRIFRTSFEVKLRSIIDMAFDRSPFVCQSQSLNLFIDTKGGDLQAIERATNALYSAVMDGYRKQLKTICYYARGKPAIKPINAEEELVCSRNNPDCVACSS